MIIIIESGATKADWRAVAENGKTIGLRTGGINVASMSADVIRKTVDEAVSKIGKDEKVTDIYFYAAGLIQKGNEVPDSAMDLDKILKENYPDAKIEYASDMLDAARAVCGHSTGIACILGTGSNSCLYDGEKIVRNVRAGGFILGDEGSGAVLGKLFLSDLIKGLVPEAVAKDFGTKFESDYMSIVKNVYRSGAPSGYLGTIAPYVASWYGKDEYMTGLVERNFRNFIERALLQYKVDVPVGVVGGFGYANREILRKLGKEYGIVFGTILAAPIDGLVTYHTGK
jgi:N-acetylglucosamine kinase-like BadF-type ATPase